MWNSLAKKLDKKREKKYKLSMNFIYLSKWYWVCFSPIFFNQKLYFLMNLAVFISFWVCMYGIWWKSIFFFTVLCIKAEKSQNTFFGYKKWSKVESDDIFKSTIKICMFFIFQFFEGIKFFLGRKSWFSRTFRRILCGMIKASRGKLCAS